MWLQEWGSNAPKVYHGGYRLELDRSWTPVEELGSKDEENRMLNAVLQSKQGIIRAAISMDSNKTADN